MPTLSGPSGRRFGALVHVGSLAAVDLELEMASDKNVSFADAMIGKKTVGRLRIRPILANERNTLPYVAADPLKQCAKSLAKPRIPKLAPGDFTDQPTLLQNRRLRSSCPFVRSRSVKPMEHLSLANQVLSNESQAILSIQVFISRSTLKRIRNCG